MVVPRLVLLCCCLVVTTCIPVTKQQPPMTPVAENPLITAAISIGAESSGVVKSGNVYVNSIAPLTILVDHMITQIVDDTHKDVEFEERSQSRDRFDLEAILSIRDYQQIEKDMHQYTISSLRNHIQDAKNTTLSSNSELVSVNSAIRFHSDNCLARVPDISKRAKHTQHDLELLNMLEARLNKIVEENASNPQTSLMLAQLHSSLRTFSVPEATQHVTQFLELESGKVSDDTLLQSESSPSEPDVVRMRNLLKKIKDELQKVLDADTNEMDRITQNCLDQETDLRHSRERLERTIEYSQNVTTELGIQLTSAEESQYQVEIELRKTTEDANRLSTRIQNRMQVYLTFIKSKQTSLLALAEMRRVIDKLTTKLETFPELSILKN